METWLILFAILGIAIYMGYRAKKRDDALLKLCGLEEKQKEVEELLNKKEG